MRQRSIVAEFRKDSGGRLTLWAMTAIEDAGEYLSRKMYDVDHSRTHGYIFHQSGCGGGGRVRVRGIYFVSGDAKVRDLPCDLMDWRGKKTRAIRKRNQTRRLPVLPKQFELQPGWDLLDWLESNAIDDKAVYCSECRDSHPGGDLCEHCWWCDKIGWYSTPGERCNCVDRETCDA